MERPSTNHAPRLLPYTESELALLFPRTAQETTDTWLLAQRLVACFLRVSRYAQQTFEEPLKPSYEFGPFLMASPFTSEDDRQEYLADEYHAKLRARGIPADAILDEAVLDEIANEVKRHYFDRVVYAITEALNGCLETYLFTSIEGSLGYDLATALEKVAERDKDALLAVLRVFPDAQWSGRWPVVRDRLDEFWRTDADFPRRYRDTIGKPIVKDGRQAGNEAVHLALCLRPELWQAVAAGQVPVAALREHLQKLGIPVEMSAKSLRKYIGRTFQEGQH